MVPENADRISTVRSKSTRLSARDGRATPLHGAKRASFTLAHALSGHRISPVQRHDATIKIWDLMTTTGKIEMLDPTMYVVLRELGVMVIVVMDE